ncbi:type VI secretion system Vgr family protein [Silvibacterium sp.]|uniref:type VI secretion system Vgr family protein n=1 Tax=Silvibacterium sp. TaxID=1964179 RepID=UPI0039E63995
MASFVQTALPVQVTTPLGANKLLVRSYSGEEGISELFRYDLELYSEDPALDFTQIVGQNVTLQIPLSSGSSQYVNGMVGRFTQAGRDDRFTTYLVELRPWLWALTMSAGCAIYQNQTTLDIVKAVFNGLGFSDFSDKTTGTYTAREYCVQYRETAFAFVSRLLEEEGIAYYFTHDASKHTLVLVDDTSNWGTCPGLTAARFVGGDPRYLADDMVLDCLLEQAVTVGAVKLDDFNFTIPATQLLATASGSDASRSVYDYPGLYAQQSDGETVAGKRLAALQTEAKTLHGSSLCRAFHAGAQFTLSGHYRSDLNAAYILRRLTQRGTQDDYSNSFSAFPAATAFHPPLRTPRPVIAGTQTATVVGKAGEEIWTDQYGRVVVQFHWDQQGQSDEKSSCWVRVAQGWAGNLWGSIFIPRIGQEVVVSFLEGNPDRPLVTGCVYNAQQAVPYTLPDDQTKSTLKTSSSKGGSGFNEIRFEDKAGSEELFLQAQKDMTVNILNNESLTVAGTRTLSVTGNETHTNKGDFSSTISGNFTLKIDGNLSIEAGGTVSIKSGTDFKITAGTSLTNKSGTTMMNDAGTSLTNQASVSQTVDGGGELTVKGGLVKIN